MPWKRSVKSQSGAEGSGLERAEPFTHERTLNVKIRFSEPVTDDQALVGNVMDVIKREIDRKDDQDCFAEGASAGHTVLIQVVEPRSGATVTSTIKRGGSAP